MAIRALVTRGYGNGTFNGTIPLVVLRGYNSSAVATVLGSISLTGKKQVATSLTGNYDLDDDDLSGNVP